MYRRRKVMTEGSARMSPADLRNEGIPVPSRARTYSAFLHFALVVLTVFSVLLLLKNRRLVDRLEAETSASAFEIGQLVQGFDVRDENGRESKVVFDRTGAAEPPLLLYDDLPGPAARVRSPGVGSTGPLPGRPRSSASASTGPPRPGSTPKITICPSRSSPRRIRPPWAPLSG